MLAGQEGLNQMTKVGTYDRYSKIVFTFALALMHAPRPLDRVAEEKKEKQHTLVHKNKHAEKILPIEKRGA